MTRLIALAFAGAMTFGGITASAAASPLDTVAGGPSAEPVRICWVKYCDRGRCTYRQTQCPRGPAQ
jgi:hypothetical protein